MAKRTDNEKTKLEYAKNATHEAIKLAKDRQTEIIALRKEIKNLSDELEIVKQDSCNANNQIISLQKINEHSKKKEEDFLAKIQGNIRTMNKYKTKIDKLDGEVQQGQAIQVQLNDTIDLMTEKSSRLSQENATMKKELHLKSSQMENLMMDNQRMHKRLCKKIMQLKASKESNKQEIRDLKHLLDDLHCELQHKDSTISALSQEMNGILSMYQREECKVHHGYESTLQHMKEKECFYESKIDTLERELSKFTLEKEKTDIIVVKLEKAAENELQERIKTENQLQSVKRSLEDQSRKTQEALKSLFHK